MNRITPVAVVLACLVLACAGAIAQEPAATQPTAGAEAANDLAVMEALMGRPQAGSQEEYTIKLKGNLSKVLELLAEMETKHPKAAELTEARFMGLVAARTIGIIDDDPKMGQRAALIAGQVLASDAPARMKLEADAYAVLLKLRPIGSLTPPAREEGEKEVLALVDRHAKGPAAVDALMIGMELAEMQGSDGLMTRLEDRLLKEHADHEAAKAIRARRELVFEATLTRLDGTTLKLPDDLKGKVVVIDFWATWCGPCVAEIPHMKTFYDTYKARGVEIVGISLDNDKEQLESFVKQRELGWIHTYSGRGWEDPTARKYGIRGIPSIWVVGKDGRVLSEKARGRLEQVVEEALKDAAATPATATAPTAPPPATQPAGE